MSLDFKCGYRDIKSHVVFTLEKPQLSFLCDDKKKTIHLPTRSHLPIFSSAHFLHFTSVVVIHLSFISLRKEKELLPWSRWHLPGHDRISSAACTATRTRSSWSLCPLRSTHPSQPWASSFPSARSVRTPRYAAPTPRTRSLPEQIRRARCIRVFAAFDFQRRRRSHLVLTLLPGVVDEVLGHLHVLWSPIG